MYVLWAWPDSLAAAGFASGGRLVARADEEENMEYILVEGAGGRTRRMENGI
jgi:hypothetical protein